MIRLHASENTVKSKDKKAKADFSSYRKLVYDDFIANFNPEFLKQHSFNQNKLFKTDDPNLVQLQFNGKEYKDDDGYMVVDTLKKVILEYERKKGTNCNIKTETSAPVRALITMVYSFKYDYWNTQIHVKYTKSGNTYLISSGELKFYMKQTLTQQKKKTNRFWSTEASIKLKMETTTNQTNWLVLPRPWYMKVVETKEEHKIEDALYNVPRKFEDF